MVHRMVDRQTDKETDMFLKIVPRGSNGENVYKLECKRYVIRHPTDTDGVRRKKMDPEYANSFDVVVAEGSDEIEHGIVILRLDWGTESAQDVAILTPANVYEMSNTGQTVDRFAVN